MDNHTSPVPPPAGSGFTLTRKLISASLLAAGIWVTGIVFFLKSAPSSSESVIRVLLFSGGVFLPCVFGLFWVLQKHLLEPLRQTTRLLGSIRTANGEFSLPETQARELHELNQALAKCLAGIRREFQNREDAAEKLQVSEEQTQAILQSLPDGLIIVNQQGVIQVANERVHSMCGYANGELMGQAIEILVPEHVRARHPSLVHSYFCDPTPKLSSGRTGELAGRRKDGSVFPAEISLSPILIPGRKETLVACSLRDSSQRVSAETDRRKLAMAVEQAPSVIFITNRDGVIEYVNRRFSEVTGYAPEEAIGQKPNMLKSERVDESVYQDLWRTILKGNAWSGELINCSKDGREFWVRLLISPMQKSNGDVTHFIAAAEEITVQKEIAARMEASEQRFRTIFENSADAIIILDEAQFLDCNSAALRMFGLSSKHDLYNFKPSDLSTPTQPNGEDSAQEAAQRIAETYARGSLRFEWMCKRQDGSTFTADVLMTVMQLDTRRVVEAVLRDVSAEKQIALELAEAKRAAVAANEAKSAFLATMSHEIRTPMNAIINMTQLTLDTELSSKQRQFLSVVESSSRGLLALLNDILDFSKIEAGKLDLETSSFSLYRLLDDLTDTFRGKVLEKEIEFVVHADKAVPDLLIGDSLRLRQVLLNLLGNAFKFTEKGEIVLRIIQVGRREAKDGEPPRIQLYFAVKDSGIGIPQEKQESLFSAFTQVDSSTSRKYGGTGLGLAISKKLVNLMGGELQVASELGRGTTFSFRTEVGFEPEHDADGTPQDVAGKFVLVIDDHSFFRDFLKSLLERFGMHCELASSGAEGLAMLERANIRCESARPFDFVLLDWVMPEMDGMEVLQKIRSTTELTGLPVIMLSAFAGSDAEAQATQMGVNAFLHKPINASTLFDAAASLYGGLRRAPKGYQPAAVRMLVTDAIRGAAVLVAEDNDANQFVIEQLLGSSGILLDIVNNGQEVLDQLDKRTDYACILMDMQMPVLDGLSATREIRRRWSDLGIPIIALTANARKESQQQCLESGMNDVLCKPIDRAELFRCLHKWITPRYTPAVDTAADSVPRSVIGEEEEIPVLAGIQVSEALLRLGVPFASLKLMLIRFRERQPQTLQDLRVALDQSDWSVASRHAHSIAGTAGNLGAHALQAAAEAMELAAPGGGPELESLYTTLKEEMDRVIQSTSVLSESETHEIPSAATYDPAALARSLEELEIQLGLGDLDGIQQNQDDCIRAGIPGEVREAFEQVQKLTEDYRFPEAAEQVASIRRTLST